jgi:hypothetical protein
MSIETRRELIRKIEEARDSRVLTYVTGDRQPAVSQIGEDSLRPMVDHLRSMRHVKRIDLFLYSRGGAIDVPWRIATALRQASDEWNILIPFRANSAATLLALGADHIIMGPQGELGPIDPQLTITRPGGAQPGGPAAGVQENINVEDVVAYMRFASERGGLTDQTALTTAFTKMTERVDPVLLGGIHRTHTHIRDVARRMILSRKKPPVEQKMATIIETLAEKVYAHGHAFGYKEALETGLPVEQASDALDPLMWELLGEYEETMNLLRPLDVILALDTSDPYNEDVTIAIIESTWGTHSFSGTLRVEGQRQMPPTLNVSMNMNLQLPPGIDPAQLPQALQQEFAAAQQALLQQAQVAVQQALRQQAPLLGAQVRLLGGKWNLDS